MNPKTNLDLSARYDEIWPAFKNLPNRFDPSAAQRGLLILAIDEIQKNLSSQHK